MTTLNALNFGADSNDNCCDAAISGSSSQPSFNDSVWGESGGCVFRVGDELYFVPTQRVAEEDMIYITCDAQKIEGSLEGWRARQLLGDIADDRIEDAILDYLHESSRKKEQGEAFVVTRNGKTFRL